MSHLHAGMVAGPSRLPILQPCDYQPLLTTSVCPSYVTYPYNVLLEMQRATAWYFHSIHSIVLYIPLSQICFFCYPGSYAYAQHAQALLFTNYATMLTMYCHMFPVTYKYFTVEKSTNDLQVVCCIL